MNPLWWKREHQIALAAAAALGLVIGLTWGLHHVHYRMFPDFWRSDGTYWLSVGAWGLFGGAIGAAFVYIRQLLRS